MKYFLFCLSSIVPVLPFHFAHVVVATVLLLPVTTTRVYVRTVPRAAQRVRSGHTMILSMNDWLSGVCDVATHIDHNDLSPTPSPSSPLLFLAFFLILSWMFASTLRKHATSLFFQFFLLQTYSWYNKKIVSIAKKLSQIYLLFPHIALFFLFVTNIRSSIKVLCNILDIDIIFA